MSGRVGGRAGAIAVLLAVAAGAQGTPREPPPAVVLGPDGDLFSWRPGGAGLVRLPLPGEARRVNDLAPAGTGRFLALLAPAPGGRHDSGDGEAGVVEVSEGGVARIVLRIKFDGEGLRAAVADGGLAYVLAHESPRSKRDLGQDWLHQIDLQSGRKTGSSALERPPMAVAAAPGGERVYVGIQDRILSFTTHPLAGSWRYRSPGANRGLAFPPGSGVLHSARGRELARFDPAVILARSDTERRRAEDDASALIQLPLEADTVLVSGDAPLAVAGGHGNYLAFIDLAAGAAIVNAEVPTAVREAAQARPVGFLDQGLIVACFPALQAVVVPLPRTAETPRVAAAAPSPPPAPAPADEAPAPTRVAPPAPAPPEAAPQAPPISPGPPGPKTPPLAPPEEHPSAGPAAPGVLGGRLSGEVGLAAAVVIYGPDSLVREAARVAPAADGTWEVRLKAPGVYRVLPVGRESRPLRAAPNFHSVEVKEGGRRDLDFRILGLP